jgi:hypothetical protein
MICNLASSLGWQKHHLDLLPFFSSTRTWHHDGREEKEWEHELLGGDVAGSARLVLHADMELMLSDLGMHWLIVAQWTAGPSKLCF